MRAFPANRFDRRTRRGWFAETLVVLGILAFAYFALTIQPPQHAERAAVLPIVSVG